MIRMAEVRPGPRIPPWIALIVAVVLLLAVPQLIHEPYWRRVVNLSMIWVVVTLGFNFILGFAGQLSLAHIGFFATGAYVSAILTTRLHLSIWEGLLGAILMSGSLGILLGLPLLRLRTHYLALATLGVDEVVRIVASNWDAVTGGHDGILNIPPPNIGRWILNTDVQQYYFLLVFTVALTWVSYRFSRSRYGLGFRAIRDSELAASMMGISTYKFKLIAFTLCALYAGIAGSLYAHLYRFLSPEAFGIELLLSTLAMLLIGGAGTVGGPLVGAVLLTFLPEWLRAFKQYYLLLYGLGLVALIVFMPDGLAGAYRHLSQRRLRPAAREGHARATA